MTAAPRRRTGRTPRRRRTGRTPRRRPTIKPRLLPPPLPRRPTTKLPPPTLPLPPRRLTTKLPPRPARRRASPPRSEVARSSSLGDGFGRLNGSALSGVCARSACCSLPDTARSGGHPTRRWTSIPYSPGRTSARGWSRRSWERQYQPSAAARVERSRRLTFSVAGVSRRWGDSSRESERH